MKILKTYNEFLNEALTLKQYKQHAYTKKGKSRFNRKRYEALFREYKEKYEGDRNAYRIYLPLIVEKRDNPIEDEITVFLTEKDYEVIDYFKGICKFKTAKNPTKIGQVLTRAGANDLMKKFVEDPERKKGVSEDLMVVISRHPYDIIGSDTDRNWVDCMTLALEEDDPRIGKISDEIDNLRDKISGFERQRENKANKGNPEKVAELNDKINQLYIDLEDLEDRRAGYTEEGENAIYWKHEVKQGSLVAYLIKKDDKNINNPLAVLNIKPYQDDKGNTYINACRNSYGVYNPDFHNTVEEWLKEVNKDKVGIFTLNPKVYCDCDDPKIYVGGRTVKDLWKQDYKDFNFDQKLDNWNLNNKFLSSLEGIEKIKDVRTLNLQHNNLENLNGIGVLENLTTLYASCNKLKNLNGIEDLKQLKSLNVQQNDLTSIAGVEQLKNLEVLDIAQNRKLKDISPAMNLNSLKHLYLHNLQLTGALNFGDLKNLETLQCNNNKLTELNIENLTNLKLLYCNNNELKNLDISKLSNLNMLNCSGNKIEKIQWLDNNKMINFRGCTYSFNPLKWPVPAEIFSKFGYQYWLESMALFKTYEFQKEFIESCGKDAEKLRDILCLINSQNGIKIDEKIKEEYKKFLKDGILCMNTLYANLKKTVSLKYKDI